ncbi:hypothetical protein PMAYCL1PPCAC_00414, partial [Pristionchus mayeri]
LDQFLLSCISPLFAAAQHIHLSSPEIQFLHCLQTDARVSSCDYGHLSSRRYVLRELTTLE